MVLIRLCIHFDRALPGSDREHCSNDGVLLCDVLCGRLVYYIENSLVSVGKATRRLLLTRILNFPVYVNTISRYSGYLL